MNATEVTRDTASGERVCPLCAHPMGEHTIDHSGRDAVLHCPVAHLPEPVDTRPLNELGMPRREHAHRGR